MVEEEEEEADKTLSIVPMFVCVGTQMNDVGSKSRKRRIILSTRRK